MHGRIDAADTVLFGSTNGTTPGVVYMRWGRRTFANCRPIRWRARLPLAPRPARGHRLRDRAGEPRGQPTSASWATPTTCATPASSAPGPASPTTGEAPLRRQDHHPGRHREGGALRLRAGPAPAGKTAHRVGQDEHAAQDRPLLLRHRARRWPRTTPTCSLRAVHRRRHGPPPRLPPRRARRAAAAQPLRRRPLRRGRGHDRRPRPGAERLLRRRLRLLRVGPRHRPRHRRPAPHQPDRHAAVAR